MYGKKYENESVDYAIKRTFSDKNYDAYSYNNSILYGERWMMYKMFHCIFSEDDKAQFKALFYAYLIIKIRLRDELIQVNSYIGFRNFQEYQSRKVLFFESKPVYHTILINFAVKNALLSQHVNYLEVRVAPKDTLSKNMEALQNFDKMVHTKQFHRPLPETREGKPPTREVIVDELHDTKYIDYKSKYFYVYHFIKPQEYYKKRNFQIVLPKQDLLDNVVWLLMQIKIHNINTSQSLMLELQNRYATLIHEIYDRAVIRFQLEHEIEQDKERKTKDIDVCTLPPEIYYLSWLLRGDDPLLYFDRNIKLHLNPKTSSVECFFNPITFWERSGINYWDECKAARKNISAISLYIAYHFNDESKRRGRRTTELKIGADYVKLVRDIQDAMMHSLSKEHIAIETNPTSNKLIGDYKSYAEHPLTRFFNLGLTYDANAIAANPQLSVSINTDDLGVFATSIENEYALMAAALEKETDENGKPKYNSRMIYDWLDRIRRMGFEQRFKKI